MWNWRGRLAAGLVACWMGLSPAVWALAGVRVTVDPNAGGVEIPADFAGVSYETQLLLPGKDGSHYFSADNKALVATFRALGIHHLRVGGNTSDKPAVPVPTEKDIDSLFAFAREAGVKVIYTVRLRESAPEKVVDIAKYVTEKYGDQVTCLAVGNEPNVYAKAYDGYRELMKRYYAAIRTVAPGAVFCGPGTTPGKAAWARGYAEDFGPTGQVKLVTQHSYPGGSARKVTDVAKAREEMLSPKWAETYQKMYDAFVPAAKKAGVAYRIEETNSFFNGGAKDVSDTLASALWGLDYMYWWAAHDAAGLNFHTGDNVAAGEDLTPCRYAMFWTAGTGYDVHPIGYAMKAFDLGSHGKLVSAEVKTGSEKANVAAYAVSGSDGHLYVTLVNKNGREADDVTIWAGGVPSAARAMFLAGPGNGLSATSGVTLGGAGIGPDGNWDGKWEALPGMAGDGTVSVHMPAATAAVVELTVK